jgi:hypothetical protein
LLRLAQDDRPDSFEDRIDFACHRECPRNVVRGAPVEPGQQDSSPARRTWLSHIFVRTGGILSAVQFGPVIGSGLSPRDRDTIDS